MKEKKVKASAAKYALERITDALEEQDVLGYYTFEVSVLQRLIEEAEEKELAE